MERISFKVLLTIVVMLYTIFWGCSVKCDEIPESQLTIPQTVSYDICTKTYYIPSEKLFYLTLASISANRFEIKEMQSKTGYILFKAAGKEFLASIVYFGSNKSMIKVTPTNNNYYFAPGIVLNIFKYIDLNQEDSVKEIPKI